MADVKDNIKKKIEELRPALQNDGGDLELVEVDEEKRRVKVKLHGACVGCPLSEVTMKQYVEVELKKAWPELEEVVSVY